MIPRENCREKCCRQKIGGGEKDNYDFDAFLCLSVAIPVEQKIMITLMRIMMMIMIMIMIMMIIGDDQAGTTCRKLQSGFG